MINLDQGSQISPTLSLLDYIWSRYVDCKCVVVWYPRRGPRATEPGSLFAGLRDLVSKLLTHYSNT
jgi:hypothetical protein